MHIVATVRLAIRDAFGLGLELHVADRALAVDGLAVDVHWLGRAHDGYMRSDRCRREDGL